MKKSCFVFLFLFVSTLLFGQKRSVSFNQELIDNALKSKPFFKKGNFIYVDDIKFENDTNYFTIYIVNNSDTAWSLPTVEGYALTHLVLYLLPKEQKPHKEILRLQDTDWISCGNSLYNKKLNTKEYISQTIKIPCIDCTNENLKRARFDFENFSGFFYYGEPKEYYFSNPFDLYYDEYDFEKFTEDIITKENKYSIVIGSDSIVLQKELTKENLRFLDRKIVLDSALISERLISFNLLFTKGRKAYLYHFEDKISKATMKHIKSLNNTDIIVVKDITIFNQATGKKEKLPEIAYRITD